MRGSKRRRPKGWRPRRVVRAGDAGAGLERKIEHVVSGEMGVDALLLEGVHRVENRVEALRVDARGIGAVLVDKRAEEDAHEVDAELGVARGHVVDLLVREVVVEADVEAPEADGLAVAELELVAAGVDEAAFAGFLFVEVAEVEQRVGREGFGLGLEGEPAGLVWFRVFRRAWPCRWGRRATG